MTRVQRACLLGTVIWLFSHGPLVALLSLHQHRQPWLAVTALLAVLAVSAAAVGRCWAGHRAVPARGGRHGVVVVPLSGLAVTRSSTRACGARTGTGGRADADRRRRPRRPAPPFVALGAELASAAVLGACILSSDLPNPAVAFAALNQPAIVWFSASVGVRLLFDRTARDVARYTVDEGVSVAERAATEARGRSARQRREDLEHDVVPLLRRVALTGPGEPVWPTLSRAAVTVERRCATTCGRANCSTRTCARRCGGRATAGARWTSSTTGAPGEPRRRPAPAVRSRSHRLSAAGFTAELRTVLAPVLDACGTARVTLRLPPQGRWATLSVDGSAQEADAVAAALRLGHLRGVGLLVETDLHTEGGTGSLWAELRPAPEPRPVP